MGENPPKPTRGCQQQLNRRRVGGQKKRRTASKGRIYTVTPGGRKINTPSKKVNIGRSSHQKICCNPCKTGKKTFLKNGDILHNWEKKSKGSKQQEVSNNLKMGLDPELTH